LPTAAGQVVGDGLAAEQRAVGGAQVRRQRVAILLVEGGLGVEVLDLGRLGDVHRGIR
jgi:hypothetical protein